MLRITALFLFLLFAAPTFAAPDSTAVRKKPAILIIDTGAVKTRHFSKTAIDDFKRKPEFIYKESYNGPSLWTRFWRWFWGWVDKLFSTRTGRKSTSVLWVILRYLIYAGAIFGIVVLVLKLSGINLLSMMRRKPYSAMEYSESAENIHEIDFNSELDKAVSVGNYRLAVRLLYLRSLKQLSDGGLINWQINKTNTAYVQELAAGEQRDTFSLLTRQFEYVWYGDFAINAEIYKRISTLFTNFKGGAR